MERRRMTPRSDWRRQFEAIGFHFHSLDDIYWDESACYRFSADEVDMLEAVTAELHQMSLKAAEHVITDRLFERFAIPEWFAGYLERSWRSGDAALYGRLDLCYDGNRPPKLLEYNADTPTALIEAALAQWNWQQEVFPAHDQFNSLHERLIQRWKELHGALGRPTVHFACAKGSDEDLGNIEYLRDTALQAGLETRLVHMEDIGWSAGARALRRSRGQSDPRALQALPLGMDDAGGIRRASARRAALGDRAAVEAAPLLQGAARRAVGALSRPSEPAAMLLRARAAAGALRAQAALLARGSQRGDHGPRGVYRRPGNYGAEGHVYQAYAPLPAFEGNYAVIGSWIVGNEPGGMGIREDVNPVTTNLSRFVPHYFE
jgi:glutathionylspermidine synthase